MSSADGVRLDKWLQVARMFKSRSQANRACALGRVRVNGVPAKPHRPLAVGDRVAFEKGDWPRELEVLVLRDKPVSKTLARELYADHSPPPPARDSLERLLARPAVRRERGSGRPTKRQRRQIDRLKKEP